jgi:hypothetical protein
VFYVLQDDQTSVAEVYNYRKYTDAMVAFKDESCKRTLPLSKLVLIMRNSIKGYYVRYNISWETNLHFVNENSFKPKLNSIRQFIKIGSWLHEINIRITFCLIIVNKAQSVCKWFWNCNSCQYHQEYLDFIKAEWVSNFKFYDEGWSWVTNNTEVMLYWHKIENDWWYYRCLESWSWFAQWCILVSTKLCL